MKNLICLFVFTCLVGSSPALFLTGSSDENTTTVTENEAPIKWEKMEHDFGIIPQDIPANTEFELTNTSKEALIFKKVKGSCGCTATDYSTEPILPGESTVIKATYNAKKIGKFIKKISVETNLSDEAISLSITGEVTEQP